MEAVRQMTLDELLRPDPQDPDSVADAALPPETAARRAREDWARSAAAGCGAGRLRALQRLVIAKARGRRVG